MFYVYLLSNGNKQIYIGYSSDLRERIKAHNRGKVVSTKNKRPWRLVYYEAYFAKYDARKREETLKNYGSTLGQLKKRLAHSLLL